MEKNKTLKVLLLDPAAKVPTRGTSHAAGFDLYSPRYGEVHPGSSAKIPLAIKMEIPEEYFGLIKERSSMANQDIFVTGGVIDADYRGEISVIINNKSSYPFHIVPGQRIGQMVLIPRFMGEAAKILHEREFTPTERGEGGFGSTGK